MQQNIELSTSNMEKSGFFKKGFTVTVTDNVAHCNSPGIDAIDLNKMDINYLLRVSKFILSHYHVDASENIELVKEFNEECISELIKFGGNLPHDSVKDWLHFRGIQGGLISI